MALLTRVETGLAAVGGVITAGVLAAGLYFMFTQTDQIAALEKEEKSSMGLEELNKQRQANELAKKLKKTLGKRQQLLSRLTAFFPEAEAKAVSIEEITRALPQKANLIDYKKEPAAKEYAWQAPVPSGDDSSEPPGVVKYKEAELSFTVRADYGAWIGCLASLEGLKRFYRFKELSLRNAGSATSANDAPLLVNVKLGTCFAIAFPQKKEE